MRFHRCLVAPIRSWNSTKYQIYGIDVESTICDTYKPLISRGPGCTWFGWNIIILEILAVPASTASLGWLGSMIWGNVGGKEAELNIYIISVLFASMSFNADRGRLQTAHNWYNIFRTRLGEERQAIMPKPPFNEEYSQPSALVWVTVTGCYRCNPSLPIHVLRFRPTTCCTIKQTDI